MTWERHGERLSVQRPRRRSLGMRPGLKSGFASRNDFRGSKADVGVRPQRVETRRWATALRATGSSRPKAEVRHMQ
jgi:hypothetical protein